MKNLKVVAKDNEILQSVLDLINQFEKIEQYYKDVTEKQGNIDKELSVWYHIVEGCEIKHISESHKLIKQGKEILKRRRDNKLEVIIIHSTHDMLKNQISILKSSLEKNVTKNSAVLLEIKEKAII